MIKTKKKLIYCGIIGLGRSGWKLHTKILGKNKNFNIHAASDINKDKLLEYSKKNKCKYYLDYKQLVDDPKINLVIISTPTNKHFEIAEYTIKKNKNLVLEKPFTSSKSNINKLYKLSKKHKVKIFFFLNFRFVEEYIKILKIINSNLIGKVFLIKKNVSYYNRRDDWQSKISKKGGIINAAAIHHLDQIIQMQNSKIKYLWKDYRRIVSKGNAPDHLKLIIKFSTNLISDLEISWVKESHSPIWEVYGTNGSIIQKGANIKIRWFEENSIKTIKRNNFSYMSNEKILWNVKKIKIKSKYNSGENSKIYDLIFKSIHNNEDAPITIQSVMKTIDLIKNIEKKE